MILFSVRRPATIAQGEHETLSMVAEGSLKPHECFLISVLRNAKLTKKYAFSRKIQTQLWNHVIFIIIYTCLL